MVPAVDVDPGSRRQRHSVAMTAAFATAVVTALCLAWFGLSEHDLAGTRHNVISHVGATGAQEWDLLSTMYSPPRSRVEAAFDLGDGQIFAGMATDPLVRRPQVVVGAPGEQAYRHQRPAYGWLGWLLSAGRRKAVAGALIVLTMASVVALITVLARALAARGVDPFVALALLVAPGVLANLLWIGPEALATTLSLVGVLRILRDDGERGVVARVDWVAVACFAGAGLCRESMLLVPATLAVVALRHRRWTSVGRLATSAVPYFAWLLVLRERIGSWPIGSEPGRLSALPLGGLAKSLSNPNPVAVCFAALTLALGVTALVMGRDPLLRWLVAAHLAFGAFMGDAVWSSFDGFGRVLLPMVAFAILAVAPVAAARTAGAPPEFNNEALLSTGLQ
jgi:hypothetical protein